MPKIDIDAAEVKHGTRYPPPMDARCRERTHHLLGDAVGLDQFGVNLLRLPDGQWSSQRHWHTAEDEFVWVVEGEVVLVEDGGETLLRAGDCAGWKAGVQDGHHLVNRSGRDALLLQVGSRSAEDTASYPDVDLHWAGYEAGYQRKDGTPY